MVKIQQFLMKSEHSAEFFFLKQFLIKLYFY